MAKKNETVDTQTGEVIETPINEVMTTTQKALSLVAANGKTYSIARRVTIPVLSLRNDNAQAMFKVLGSYAFSKEKTLKTGEKMGSAPVLPVLDLTDDMEKKLILPELARSVLDEDYPDASYVGKMFALQKRGKRDGKRYNDIELVEIQEG